MWGRFMAFQGRRHTSILFFWGKISKCSKRGKKKKSPWQDGTKEFFGKNPQYQV
jgi:hypothetical protein